MEHLRSPEVCSGKRNSPTNQCSAYCAPRSPRCHVYTSIISSSQELSFRQGAKRLRFVTAYTLREPNPSGPGMAGLPNRV
jgi:hypothetical protein